MENKRYDSCLNATRAFLLVSIVAAHCGIAVSNDANRLLINSLRWWKYFGCLGVPGFFIISGYLYRKMAFQEFWRKKIQSIILPWFSCGVVVYFVCQFPKYSMLDMIKFLLGYNSFLYYLTILILFYLIYILIQDNQILNIVFIVLMVISLILTEKNILVFPFTNYLNPLNWIGYFAFGRLLRMNDILYKLQSYKHMIVAILLMLIITVFSIVTHIETYFCWTLPLGGIMYFFACYTICSATKNKERIFSVLNMVGRLSFTIYLLHMPVAAILKKIVYLTNEWLYIVLPLAVIGTCVICLVGFDEFIYKTNRKTHFIFKSITGMR